MSGFDSFYCGAVAGPDSDACARWLQTGRDRKWAPPPPPPAGFDWSRWVPVVAAVVVVITLLVATRLLRATRRPERPVISPGMPCAVPTVGQVTVADTRWQERTGNRSDGRTEAHSGPTSW